MYVTFTRGKPPVIAELHREDYQIRIALRTRRAFRRLSNERKVEFLRASADQLEVWSAQMRDEASELARSETDQGY